MDRELHPGEAADALAEIQWQQQQVIARAIVPAWYWWAVGVLMVVLAAAVRSQFRDVRLHSRLLDGRGVMTILAFDWLIVGCTIGIAFAFRAAGLSYPATIACGMGGLAMGLSGPLVNRRLHRIMLGNRAGIRR